MVNYTQTFEGNIRKILIVDRDAASRRSLSQVIDTNGFQVEESDCPKEALARLQQEHFDGVFFRFPLDPPDDLRLMSSARRFSPEILIVVQENHPTTERAIAAIKAGVADYLTGPCNTQEVAQSIFDAFRRHHEMVRRLTYYVSQAIEAYYSVSSNEHELPNGAGTEMGPTLTSGLVHLARLPRVLSFLGRESCSVQLTKGESDVLAVLMSHPGEAVSCWAIVREAWGYDMIDIEAKSVVRPHISRLRQKLTGTPIGANAIVTVRGLGYMFVSEPLATPPDDERPGMNLPEH